MARIAFSAELLLQRSLFQELEIANLPIDSKVLYYSPVLG
jgi:hypothetical protein